MNHHYNRLQDPYWWIVVLISTIIIVAFNYFTK